MFTVCPKCALTLVVTAADLRVAQGYVRCGRCLNVFNALARLSEERPGTAPAPEAAALEESAAVEEPMPGAESAPVEEPPADTPQQSPAPSFTDDADTGEIEIELDASFLVTAVHGPTVLETLEETGELEAEEIAPAPGGTTPAAAQPHPAAAPPHSAAAPPHPAPAPSHSAPAPSHSAAVPPHPAPAPPHSAAASASAAAVAPHPPAALAAHTPAQSAVAPAQPVATPAQSATAALASITESRAEPTPLTSGPPTQGHRNAASVSETLQEAGESSQTNTEQHGADTSIELATQPQRAALAWKLGAGALVILLLVQIVNHNRDSLASDPVVGAPLSGIYSALGVKLAPRWNIHAYDVRQLGASAAGATAGQIIVRASVKNTASRAQPLPLLRVTLQDRFGNRIAARDVPPSDYLPASVVRTSLLAAGSRVDATMVFVDPGPQAVGFEIDACLRRQGGEVACAHGP